MEYNAKGIDRTIPVVISHPLNKFAIDTHGGKPITSPLYPPGFEDHAPNVYKIDNVAKVITSPMLGAQPQQSKPQGVRGALRNLFARKGNL